MSGFEISGAFGPPLSPSFGLHGAGPAGRCVLSGMREILISFPQKRKLPLSQFWAGALAPRRKIVNLRSSFITPLLRPLPRHDNTSRMVRPARALALLLCCAPCALLAQEGQGNSAQPAGNELRIMRSMLEQQSKQIDVLAQEVARLNLLLESRLPTAAGLAPTPADTEAPAPASAPEIPKALPAQQADQPAEAAPPTPTGPVHIVTKGETLTVIARHYKVTVPELLKVNKIADVRKLQIGQTLVLPPGAKIPSSPTPSPQP